MIKIDSVLVSARNTGIAFHVMTAHSHLVGKLSSNSCAIVAHEQLDHDRSS